MISLEKFKEQWVGNITFPLTNCLLNRRGVLKYYRSLMRSEWLPQERLTEIQFNRAVKVIRYANQYIPFYSRRFKDIGLVPEDLKGIEHIKRIPSLTRQEVIDHHKEMVDRRHQRYIPIADKREGDPGTPIPLGRFRRNKLLKNTSSGSTGAPTVFYDNGTRAAISWAHELRLKCWHGVTHGAKEARMVRLSVDYLPSSKVNRLRRMLWHQLILPGINMGEKDYHRSLRAILGFRPEVLWGFTPSLAGLAQYVLNNQKSLNSYRPKVVIGWAAPVYDHEREILEKAFDCPVTNIYGSREVGHVAGLCPHGSFHINQENLLVEIDRGDIDSEAGEILVTTLDDSPMPFIRYRMGDVGQVESSRCACGRSLQVLTTLLGRTGEIFITKDGRMISPNFWCRTFMSGKISNAVRRFQVVYKKNKDLKIRIQRDKGFSSDTESYIKETVARNFSPDTNLELEYVSGIGPEISGKYQMVTWE